MAKVKCRFCKKQIDRKNAYINKKLNDKFNIVKEYYCSEECFNNKLEGKRVKEQKIKEANNLRISTRDEVKDILDIALEKNVYFTNLYNDLESTYGVDTIVNYLKYEKEYLINIISNNYFETTFAKIKYFFAVVQNNIEKYIKRDDIQEIKEINTDLIDDFDLCTPEETNKKKRSLSDIMKGV